MEIKIAHSDSDILKCFKVIKELRPHLGEENFLSLIKKMMAEGYELAFIEENNKAVAAVGFRYLQLLYNGTQYYIDDLTTLPESRGRGYAGRLLDFVETLAREKGFNTVTLDSGHQRFDAHRLYLNKGFKIVAHHFSKTL
ncbi:MAG: GNAT family N-acetyltransferase [Chitinophagaceae bacterium]|nr:GNAT family N-acetyltransferase [Chitinophagaceae bacterium]